MLSRCLRTVPVEMNSVRAISPVGEANGKQPDHFLFALRQGRDRVRLSGKARATRRPPVEPQKIRGQEVENCSVAVGEVLRLGIESEAADDLVGAHQPQLHRVLDPERSSDLVVEIEPVELGGGQEVGLTDGSTERPGRREERVLRLQAEVRLGDRAWNRQDAGGRRADSPAPSSRGVVPVRDDVARDQPAKRPEHRAGEGIVVIGIQRDAQETVDAAELARSQAVHGPNDIRQPTYCRRDR